jgi:flagellar protein FlaG
MNIGELAIADPTQLPAHRSTPVAAPIPAPELPERAAPQPKAIVDAAAELARHARVAGRNLAFRIDDATGRIVVSVHDSVTGELVRQIPTEEVLRIARHVAAAGENSALLDVVA